MHKRLSESVSKARDQCSPENQWVLDLIDWIDAQYRYYKSFAKVLIPTFTHCWRCHPLTDTHDTNNQRPANPDPWGPSASSTHVISNNAVQTGAQARKFYVRQFHVWLPAKFQRLYFEVEISRLLCLEQGIASHARSLCIPILWNTK